MRRLSLADLPFLAQVQGTGGPFVFLLSRVTTTDGATTAVADTTGATIIVVGMTLFGTATTPTLTDNKGNIYTRVTPAYFNGSRNAMIWACTNPIVGAGHTFTPNYGLICSMAFSGAPSVIESNSRANTFGVSIQPGSISPSSVSNLFVTCANGDPNSGGTESITTAEPGFIQVVNSGSAIFSGIPHLSVAYKIKTDADALAENPTWTCAPACVVEASQANFAPA